MVLIVRICHDALFRKFEIQASQNLYQVPLYSLRCSHELSPVKAFGKIAKKVLAAENFVKSCTDKLFWLAGA
jgi:hypothetical protein